MNGQMDRRCNDTNCDKAYYLLVVYEWLFSVSIAELRIMFSPKIQIGG